MPALRQETLVIEAQELRYRYQDGTKALDAVSFCIRHGEKVCLAGPNGAGKSTLLASLAGLIRPHGELKVMNKKGVQARGVDPAVFGLVFQAAEDQLFCANLGDDLAFGPRNQGKSEAEVSQLVRHGLQSVGLAGFEQRCAHHLSGGEKKRAAIAAVLSCQPAILALDEPWANLDARASKAVSALLAQFSGTLVVASHDLAKAAQLCSRLLILDQGQLVADGPMLALLAQAELLEAHGLAS